MSQNLPEGSVKLRSENAPLLNRVIDILLDVVPPEVRAEQVKQKKNQYVLDQDCQSIN